MEYLLTPIIQSAFLIVPIFLLFLARIINIKVKPFLLCMCIFYVYSAILLGGREAQTYLFGFLAYNWLGKILAAGISITALLHFSRKSPNFELSKVGFTLKQKPNSVIPSLILTALFISLYAFQASSFTLFENDIEKILYQAILPGIDEEIMFRGILLYVLCLAVMPRFGNKELLQFVISGIAITFLFGAGHSAGLHNGFISFNPTIFINTSLAGLVLLWMRYKTGSILLPVLMHNLINIALMSLPQ